MPTIDTLVRKARARARANGHRLEDMNRYTGDFANSRDASCTNPRCNAIAWVDQDRKDGPIGGRALNNACPTL